MENYRLRHPPKPNARLWLSKLGRMECICSQLWSKPMLRLGGSALERVQVLRQVWQQYYDLSKGRAKWRAGPQADEQKGVLRSPYESRGPHRQKAGNRLVG